MTELPQPPRGKHLAKGLSIVVVLLAVAFTLYEQATILQQLERSARDFHTQLLPPRQATEILVVRITDADYASLFASTSPLNADSLAELLSAIIAGRPRLIVVDLATAESQFRPLARLEDDVPIVWGRESASCDVRGAPQPECTDGDRTGLLGFAGLDRPDTRYGLVEMERDPDGVIRRYQRYRAADGTLRPSLAAAAVEALGDGLHGPSDDPLYIRYAPLPPGAFLEASGVIRAARSPDFGEAGILRDQIVLLGGAYREARDEHATPVGRMFGVDLQAQVIQTELEGGGLRPLGRGLIGTLVLLNSLALLMLFRLVSLRRAFWIAIVGIPLLATAWSMISTGSPFALWPYLVPVLVAVLVQQLYAQAAHYRDALIDRLGKRLSSKPVEEGVTTSAEGSATRE
ncbi:MAG: CHASE2 domain-containing protein [Gemmatimonadota bacterium]|nr:MAG: CHASE2 domain-containing protein [Gemmatimonadota bacterium]